MALFPAFAGCSSASAAPEQTGLDWLNNQSFCTEDALSLHQRTQLAPPPAHPVSPLSSNDPKGQTSGSESSDSGAERRKKKRKKKKKKHKKHKKRKSNSEDDDEDDKEHDMRDLKNPQSMGAAREDARGSDARRSIGMDEAQSAPEETFRVDRKADPANWEYKSLYRGDIVRYRRRGHSCLGIDPKKQQVIWEGANNKKTSRKRADRYYSKAAVQTLRAKAESVSCGKDGADSTSGAFIPVKDCEPHTTASSSGPVSWVNPLGVYDSSTAMWLQGKGGPESKTPAPEPRDTSILEKVEDHNKRVREDPTDIKTWMEFVSFQDELIHQPSMYSTSENEMDSHRMSLKMVLEKKLSILERAIESNPASTELKLARLRLCTEFWENAALLKEWQKLVFLHPNEPQLWKKYLQFCQGQFSTFSVSKVNAIYGKCLSTLSAVHDGSMLSHPVMPGTERSMYDIFLQQCHFLRQAGHCEKVVSVFQALLDFTFYKPDSVKNMTTKEQVEFFEPFWDSGEPRFGEKGAKGWSSWMRQQERGGWVIINNLDEEEDDGSVEEIDIKDKSRPRPEIWLNMECAREAQHWIPWRPDAAKKQTEEDCEDPERQIFFDDIGPSMFKISSAELKFHLVLSFLQLLGVPCDSRPPPTSLYLSLDDSSIFDFTPSYQWLLTSYELPLSGVSAVGHLDTMSRDRGQIGQCKEGERFIQDVFQAAMSCVTAEQKMKLSVLWLQYEITKVVRCLEEKNKKKLKSQGKRSKRLAKGLLKETVNRNSLALWKQYALLEWLLGSTEEARKVFDAAIGLAGSQGLKDQALRSLSLLYAELEAEAGAQPGHEAGSRALHVLTSLAESSIYVPFKGPVPAVSILKARKAYERALEDSLKLPVDSALVTVTGCLALFQYLTAGIDSAVAVFRQVSDSLAPPAGACDEAPGSWSPLQAVTVMHTNLLKYHVKVSVYPRAPLREALMDALRLSPHNVTLWKSYIQSEGKSHNVNKARRFIDGIRRATDALEPYLFAIQAEEGRKKLLESVQRGDTGDIHVVMPETGLSNRIKVLYERGLATEQGSRCLLLWRMYLRFMVSQGHQDRSRGLFYKAIQSCPWAKVLYLDAVEYFPDRLQEIVDLMTEKELRVRVPLEELDLLLED
ncbi:nuclear exosome regulator NRDE2-like [Bufo gargarizans]|uniref:nuclear exosome regulator NRDE2-like n=1 Tax=Bufo gargarizans TaxID=30331 RepID=UPI001CF210BB|nr:nuclear exosome regulator NRDE2-like [Bufo gargarizans]